MHMSREEQGTCVCRGNARQEAAGDLLPRPQVNKAASPLGLPGGQDPGEVWRGTALCVPRSSCQLLGASGMFSPRQREDSLPPRMRLNPLYPPCLAQGRARFCGQVIFSHFSANRVST